jgi:hypothetical protein
MTANTPPRLRKISSTGVVPFSAIMQAPRPMSPATKNAWAGV